MYNILFVCYGNICRSPMAEMIFKDLIYKNNKRYKFSCASRATSMEELGNNIYPAALNKLKEQNISIERHIAKQLTIDDYNKYDYIIAMEERNKKDILRIIKDDPLNKIHLLLDYTDNPHDITDPWYSGDFDTAFKEINEGCHELYNYLLNKENSNEI
ncbi:MAG TPA: low molecular weight phosphotyrosine protein phosphatase [Firmicutes bacterium]|nr:low molecular weight phosphotyrosine protein phosphatase [Bacillota bacterium]